MLQLTPKQSYLILGGAFIVGGAVGFLVGSKTQAKKDAEFLEESVQDLAVEEIEKARIHYATLYKRDEFSDPAKLVDPEPPVYTEGEERELQTIINHYTSPDSPQKVTNIFINGVPMDENFDYEAELAKRDEDPDKPFVISHDEFMENDPENEQVTVTYFEGDGVVASERDEPMDDELVGTDNLTRFGHGSRDNNVVYVRNPKISLDFEVIKSDGTYAEEVAGLRHSDEPGIRRFRDYD